MVFEVKAVNASLLSAFLNVNVYGEQQLLDILHCKPFVGNEYTRAGIELEDSLEAGTHELSNEIEEGGSWQEWFRVKVDGFLLYGKLDILYHHKIVDVKWKKAYKSFNSYYDSPQWRLYCHAMDLKHFEYIIFTPDGEGLKVYREEYFYTQDERSKLITWINYFFMYIERNDLVETYNNFLKKKRLI